MIKQKIFKELIDEIFPNLVKTIIPQSSIESKDRKYEENSQSHLIMKLPKIINKEKVLKSARRKTNIICKRTKIKIKAAWKQCMSGGGATFFNY